MGWKTPLALVTLIGCSGAASSQAFEDAPALGVASTSEGDASVQPPLEDATLHEDAHAADASVDAKADHAGDSEVNLGQEAGLDASASKVYGVAFDGTAGQRVLADLPADMSGQATVTIEGYFRYDAVTSTGFLFQTPGPYCAVATTGEYAGQLACCWPGGTHCVYSGSQFTLGAFHHVALVFHDQTTDLFLDGSAKASAPAPVTVFPVVNVGLDSTTRLTIGAPHSTAQSSRSTVDELRIGFTRRYVADFSPPKHVTPDADSKYATLMDQGAGPSCGGCALLGGASWVEVSR